MIRPHVRLQLLVFAVVSLLGISYVGVRYVGLGDRFLGGGYTVAAELPASGGIFTGAEVTYRGVTVGRVGSLHLLPRGVRVDLRLESHTRIPAATRAVVADRSAVGEQYVDLQPDTDGGPWLADGAVIPRERTAIPLPTETLLLNLDRLVNSVDRDDLRTVIDELGTAFAGSGPDLQRLVDASDALTRRAYDALPETLRLIDDGQTVLATQRADRDHILRWAHSLADLSDTLRASDADIRRLLANGRASATELDALLSSTRSTLPVLLGNLVTVGQIQARRLPGLRQILVTYPLVVAGGFTVVPGDGTSHFGLVLNGDDPPPCTRGYETTATRVPQDTRETAANARAHCAEPQGSPTAVRGAQHAPRPGGADPGPAPTTPTGTSGASGAGRGGTPTFVAGYDPVTGQAVGPDGRAVVLGSTGGQQQVAGGQSWKRLLLGPLTR